MRLKPLERAWCSEIMADVIMHHTGYSVIGYNPETDISIYGYFVPNIDKSKVDYENHIK